MRLTLVILNALLCLNLHAQDNDEALISAAEKLVSEGSATPTVTPATGEAAPVSTAAQSIADDVKQEAQTPVFTKSEKITKSENSLIWRLVGSLAFIVFAGGGLIIASRRWTRKKDKGGEKVRIEMLHQFHLGPKRSLALVRVAGESVLIGCTDQSINLLKTVTLLDEGMEGALGKDFNGFLDEEFTVQDMRNALSSRV